MIKRQHLHCVYVKMIILCRSVKPRPPPPRMHLGKWASVRAEHSIMGQVRGHVVCVLSLRLQWTCSLCESIFKQVVTSLSLTHFHSHTHTHRVHGEMSLACTLRVLAVACRRHCAGLRGRSSQFLILGFLHFLFNGLDVQFVFYRSCMEQKDVSATSSC